MSDTQPVASPNSNKTVGSASGGLAGGAVGTALVALLDLKYPGLSNIATAAIASFLATAFAGVGAWLAPLLTAAQHRAIKALDGAPSSPDKAILNTIAAKQGTQQS